jgi:hypothetical protein
MKKDSKKIDDMVSSEKRVEKLYFVLFGQVRRHSRVLYIPLDPTVVRLHHVKKGDIVKYHLMELRRAPDEDEPVRDARELET